MTATPALAAEKALEAATTVLRLARELAAAAPADAPISADDILTLALIAARGSEHYRIGNAPNSLLRNS